VQSELEALVPAHKSAVQFSSFFLIVFFWYGSGACVRGFRFVFLGFVFVLFSGFGYVCGSYNFFPGIFVLSSGARSVML
jgi:hypothetical protein